MAVEDGVRFSRWTRVFNRNRLSHPRTLGSNLPWVTGRFGIICAILVEHRNAGGASRNSTASEPLGRVPGFLGDFGVALMARYNPIVRRQFDWQAVP